MGAQRLIVGLHVNSAGRIDESFVPVGVEVLDPHANLIEGQFPFDEGFEERGRLRVLALLFILEEHYKCSSL
jgi:hypothetical protein